MRSDTTPNNVRLTLASLFPVLERRSAIVIFPVELENGRLRFLNTANAKLRANDAVALQVLDKLSDALFELFFLWESETR